MIFEKDLERVKAYTNKTLKMPAPGVDVELALTKSDLHMHKHSNTLVAKLNVKGIEVTRDYVAGNVKDNPLAELHSLLYDSDSNRFKVMAAQLKKNPLWIMYNRGRVYGSKNELDVLTIPGFDTGVDRTRFPGITVGVYRLLESNVTLETARIIHERALKGIEIVNLPLTGISKVNLISEAQAVYNALGQML